MSTATAAPTSRELSALERAVFDRGLPLDAALRDAALSQIGRVIEALEAETARLLDQTAALEPLDTAAALRVGRTWRQILPTALLLQAEAAPHPDAVPEPATPPGLAARIAAEQNDDAQ